MKNGWFMGYNKLNISYNWLYIYVKFYKEVKKTIKIGGDGSYILEN